MFFLLIIIGLDFCVVASDDVKSKSDRLKESKQQVPLIKLKDNSNEQEQKKVDNSVLMSPDEMAEQMDMDNDEINKFLNEQGWTFSSLLKKQPNIDELSGAEKQKKALEWANEIISKRDLQIMNYLYKYGKICENFEKIKKYLEIRFEYQIIHGSLKNYLQRIGMDVYYDEKSNTINLLN